ncbi:MAG: hypothetical protein M0Z80_13315, partial [Treponema sp.]|nr:hypothetical protein [Treponema sp.]
MLGAQIRRGQPRRGRPRALGAAALGLAPAPSAGAHLDAYRTGGWEVAAVCSRTRAKAEARAA